MRLFFVALAALAASACSNRARDPGEADSGSPTTCTEDDECSDGLYCNGSEQCVDGNCVEAELVPCSDGIACTTDTCSEVDDTCSHTAPDSDADGYGDATCVDGEGDPIGTDCDDDRIAVHPDALEVCDGVDTDCSGTIDSDEMDGDGDRWLPCTGFIDHGAPDVDGGDDCDDQLATRFPEAAEACDGIDNDCDCTGDSDLDGALCGPGDDNVDEDFDFDRDDHMTAQFGCEAIYPPAELDCSDTNFLIYPGATEWCDGADNDCDGLVDANDPMGLDTDFDGDGQTALFCGGTDCHDGNPYVYTGAPEICDSMDNDCNDMIDTIGGGVVVLDADGDGYLPIACDGGGNDCDDRDPHVFPDSDETSGFVRQCRPVVYPGFIHEWHFARVRAPDYFWDPESGKHYLYFAGHEVHTQTAFGYVVSTDGYSWSNPIRLSTLASDPLLAQISSPSVMYVPGAARPYVLYYTEESGTTVHKIRIATAVTPTGPFRVLGPEVQVVPGPVLEHSSDPSFLDTTRVRAPDPGYDAMTETYELWYTGVRSGSGGRVFYATSQDGLTWTRHDDAAGAIHPLPVIQQTQPWEGGTTADSDVVFRVGPDGSRLIEAWYASNDQIGYATGTSSTTWTVFPESVFTMHSVAERFDGLTIPATTTRYDPDEDIYYLYYEASTETPTPGSPGADPIYGNWDGAITYIASAVNWAPQVDIDPPTTLANDFTLTGTVGDSAPSEVVVSVSSDVDGELGLATVDVVAGSSTARVTAGWSLAVTGLGSGQHELTVRATDGALIVREATLTIAIP